MLGGIAGPYCRIGSSSKGLPATPHGSLKNRFLENLVGDRKISRRIRGTVVETTMRGERVLNHQFVKLHMKGPGQPPSYEASVLVGCDASWALRPARVRRLRRRCDG